MKSTPYYTIFTDIYNLMKNAYPARAEDEYWKNLLIEGNSIYKKYEDTAQGGFVKSLVVAVLNELERENMQ
jgi:hypothetical protein